MSSSPPDTSRMPLEGSDANDQATALCYQAVSSWNRFEQSGEREDLDSAIALQRAALDSCQSSYPDRSPVLYTLALFLLIKCERWEDADADDLGEAIQLNREALDLRSEGHTLRSDSLANLARCFWTSFQVRGRIEDLDESITFHRAALALRPEGHPNQSDTLDNLGYCLRARFDRRQNVEDLDEAIALYRAILQLRPGGHPDRCYTLDNLAYSLKASFGHCERTQDLDEAIALNRATLELRPDGHPLRASSLCNLSDCLLARFEHAERTEDLEEVITLNRAVLALRPKGHPDHPQSLENLRDCLSTFFDVCGSAEILEEIIVLERAALDLRPDGHAERAASLGDLATSLRLRFESHGRIEDLQEAVELHRSALDLRPEGHPDRSSSLISLAVSLKAGFDHNGKLDDLEEAIGLEREALRLRPGGHPGRSLVLANYGNSIRTRFEHGGNMEDLEEAILLQRSALELRPEDHPDHSSSMSDLASSLWMRFEFRGRIEDIEESVALHRAALKLRPEGHPLRFESLINLASSLSSSFQYRRRIEDLEEAIALERATLELRPKGYPLRSVPLGNLAESLRIIFEHRKETEYLEEAIALSQAALELRPEHHPDRALSLGNLALSLWTRFDHYKRIEDLERAITLEYAALELRPEGHAFRSWSLGNLAGYLRTRFEHCEKMEDLEKAISFDHAVLKLRPEGHPDHSASLESIARSFYACFRKSGHTDDLVKSIESLRRAAGHAFSSFPARLEAVHRWITIARSEDHHTLLEAYRTAMMLLQRTLTIRPTLSAQHRFLSNDSRYQTLALDAAAYAIDKGDFPHAIELLEQGRALLWSQMRGLRTPLDQLEEVNKELAERFESCSRCLEALVASSDSRKAQSSTSQEPKSVDQMFTEMRRLSEEQEAIIDDIRQIPGFEGFLRAATFDALQRAAEEGPVIMLNLSEHRSDALIVLPRKDRPCICIPLDEIFYSDSMGLHEELIAIRRKSGVGSDRYDEILRRVMKVVWDRVVSKVVQKLKEIGIAEGSRIWWCPTSVLTAFPFHAAGPYQGADGKLRYLLDDYLSSYTPTLTSLIKARSGIREGDPSLLFLGDTKLPSANKERHAISRIRRIDRQIFEKRASPDRVIKSLRKVEWVHFVCHGILADEPFDSSLKLPGGKLTLLDIARAHLPNAEFAFLSACHTAEQNHTTALDESLHLAAAMQFCGFRSVVGTMWQLLDRDGPFFSKAVYGHLTYDMQEGETRFKGAAAAVRKAALSLREWKDEGPNGEELVVTTERWVNLVHIGA